VRPLWLLFFVMLGDFSFVGTVLQLEQLRLALRRGRRRAPGPLPSVVLACQRGLFSGVAFFRRHSLAALGRSRHPPSKETPHGR
jgi:hypothetical protein